MMMHRALLLLALWLAAGIAHAADTLATMSPLSDRRPAPDFTLRDMQGKSHRLSAQRGKVVFVNFWATWCPPCRKEMPSMQRAWEQLKGERFVMYAVNVGEDEETIFGFSFATGIELTFPILLDTDGATVQRWPVLGLPTTFVIDAQGRIAFRAVGGREWDDPALLKGIRALIAEDGKTD